MGFSPEDSLLGQQTQYVSQYDPSILFPIPRKHNRENLPALDWHGVDIWTGYEISWLNEKGKPQVAVAEFVFDANSPCIVESKSFKLYLNSLNQTKLASVDVLCTLLVKDLEQASGGAVQISLWDSAGQPMRKQTENSIDPVKIDSASDYRCIDHLDVCVSAYHPDADLLSTSDSVVSEKLVSHLLKSNCPVTGQPDWASVFVEYTGSKIDPSGLLKYLISFREHQDFHENCVERIFADLMHQCRPESLTVYARYTRRGGLDINPVRTTALTLNLAALPKRSLRQ